MRAPARFAVGDIAIDERAAGGRIPGRHRLEHIDGAAGRKVLAGVGANAGQQLERGQHRVARRGVLGETSRGRAVARLGHRRRSLRGADREHREQRVRATEHERNRDLAGETGHLVPGRGGLPAAHQVRPHHTDLGGGVQRKRPLMARVAVGAERGPHGRGRPRTEFGRAEQLVERVQRGAGGPKPGMVDDEHVVPQGQLRHRPRLEPGQWLAVPGQWRGHGAVPGVRRGIEPLQLGKRGIAPRVVPRDPAQGPGGPGHGCSAPTTPAARRSSTCCSLTPSSARISRVCSPASGAPWRTDDGDLVNRIANPGVVTSPSVGWR